MDKRSSYNPHVDRRRVKGLTEKIIKRLDKHSKSHSKDHINKMANHLKKGKTFKQSHEMALEDDK